MGARRAQHHVPRGPELHAGLQVELQLLLNRRPSVRNCEGVDGCNYEFDPRRSLPRTPTTTATGSSSASRRTIAPAVRLDRQQQPAGPLHDRVGSLVHGGQSPVGRCGWPQRLWQGTASPTGGIVAQDAGPPTMRFNGGSVPTRPSGSRDGRLRLREERLLAVLSDVTWARGCRQSRPDSSSAITISRAAAGAQEPVVGNFNFDRLGTAGFDGSGNNLTQTGDPFASFLLGQVHASNQTHPGVPYLPGDVYRACSSTTSSSFRTS